MKGWMVGRVVHGHHEVRFQRGNGGDRANAHRLPRSASFQSRDSTSRRSFVARPGVTKLSDPVEGQPLDRIGVQPPVYGGSSQGVGGVFHARLWRRTSAGSTHWLPLPGPPDSQNLSRSACSDGRIATMKINRGTYTSYSIACGVVWVVILVLVGSVGSESKRNTLFVVFLGWLIGWLSATIARAVYPPPKSRRPGVPS